MNPVFRFIYWSMNYHLAHHLFPMVLYHALPEMHALVKGQCPPAYPSRWTGLSARRVRSLLKKYRTRSTELKIQRPRGDSPFNIELLLRSPRRRLEAALFATIHQELSIQSGAQPQAFKPELGAGELVCRAYEAFRERETESVLSIDQAFLVLTTTSRNVEFALGRCPSCTAPMLIDRLAVVPRRCGNCSAAIRIASGSVEVELGRTAALSGG